MAGINPRGGTSGSAQALYKMSNINDVQDVIQAQLTPLTKKVRIRWLYIFCNEQHKNTWWYTNKISDVITNIKAKWKAWLLQQNKRQIHLMRVGLRYY